MNRSVKGLASVGLVAAFAFGAVSLFTPADALGKGKPKPPPCECPETIEIAPGVICTLEDCGFDCVYACPLPF